MSTALFKLRLHNRPLDPKPVFYWALNFVSSSFDQRTPELLRSKVQELEKIL